MLPVREWRPRAARMIYASGSFTVARVQVFFYLSFFEMRFLFNLYVIVRAFIVVNILSRECIEIEKAHNTGFRIDYI